MINVVKFTVEVSWEVFMAVVMSTLGGVRELIQTVDEENGNADRTVRYPT